MVKQNLLHVGLCKLEPLQVAHKMCLFRDPAKSRGYDRRIRQTFQRLREWIVCHGLEPRNLLHIGVPVLEEEQLIMYDCCIEFPFPVQEEHSEISLRVLPGGEYALLRVEKRPSKIGKAIELLYSDYIPRNALIVDEERPTYEIYYEDTMEYCVPIQK